MVFKGDFLVEFLMEEWFRTVGRDFLMGDLVSIIR